MKAHFSSTVAVCALCSVGLLQGGQNSDVRTGATSLLRQGILLLQQQHYQEAREEFLRVTKSNPESAEAFFYLGIAERGLRSPEHAEAALRHSLVLNPRSANALYNLGVILLE